ncbi:hypothetical protein Thiowin_05038 [Thiorhodovibrio winogradskyi]|uniref:RepB-like DNA primase domain-containing protein n=1 Tax=Thiorhodovibrio winogradskyi TaxID=77007 RepID=A0ABZ0SI66_9GAMM|nr:DUF3987 domain-containing protein [Thiorhodovibrio winogradskyi]
MLTDNKAVAAGTAHGSMSYCALNSTTTTDPEPFSLAAPEVYTAPSPGEIKTRVDILKAGGWTQSGIVAEVRARGVKLDTGDLSNAMRGKHGKRLTDAQWQAIQALAVDPDKAGKEQATDPAPYHRAAADTAQAMRRMAEARRFLAILDPEAESFCFQTFDDRGRRRELARTIPGDIETVWPELERLNQAGAGVFVTINETRGQTRRAGDVVRVRAVFADFDPPKTAPAPALADYPLPPVMLVESSPGKAHAYWPVDGVDLLHFKPMQQAIVARFNSDPQPVDLPRVMRLPGFFHKKDPDNPHLVRVAWCDERQPYPAEQVRAAFGLNGHQRQQEAPQQQTTDQADARPAQNEDLLAQLLAGADIHQAALTIVGRMVADGVPDATIKAVFQALALQVAAARGADRAAALSGSELARMLAGARAKGYGDAQQQPDEWLALEPLARPGVPEPYPVDALPERVRAAVSEVQGFVKAPLPLVATSALSALSVAIQAHVDVARADKLTGPSSLFTLVIADSGERKSTVDGFFTAAIREYEAKQAEAMKPELEDYRAKLAAWEAERDGYLAGIRQASKAGKRDQVKSNQLSLQDLEHSKPAEPRVPRLLRGDDTPEALAWSLAKQWPSAGVLSSEAGVIFGAHGMGKDSVMRNLALLNVLWDGGQHDVGRRTSESFTVKGARFTAALTHDLPDQGAGRGISRIFAPSEVKTGHWRPCDGACRSKNRCRRTSWP